MQRRHQKIANFDLTLFWFYMQHIIFGYLKIFKSIFHKNQIVLSNGINIMIKLVKI